MNLGYNRGGVPVAVKASEKFPSGKKAGKQLSAKPPVKKLNRKPVRFPWFPLIIACVLAGFFVFAPHSWEEISKLSQLIEVDAVQSAQAEGATSPARPDKTKGEGKKSAEGSTTAEKSAGRESDAASANKEQTKTWAPEEIALFRNLEQRKKDLDQRETDLNHMEEELQKQKVELEARLKTLEDTRRKIAGQLSEKVKTDQERVDRLVTMMENMKPDKAAGMLKDLNEDLAVEILGKMKQKSAAEILNLLPSDRAQKFSEKFAGYRRSGT